MDRSHIDHPVTFMVDSGVLFEVNRQVLHPLGLELEWDMDDDGTVTGVHLLDNRASPDPIYFTRDEFEEGRRRYEAYMNEHGRRNLQKRRQIGMVVQTGPNLPRHIHGKHDGDSQG